MQHSLALAVGKLLTKNQQLQSSNEFVKCKLPILILKLNFANGPELSIVNHQSQIAKRKWTIYPKCKIVNHKSVRYCILVNAISMNGFLLDFQMADYFHGGIILMGNLALVG
jgi:hypothetical protein